VGRSVAAGLRHNQEALFLPQHLEVRRRLEAWKRLGSDSVLRAAIQHGIRCPLVGVPRPVLRQTSKQDQELLGPTIQTYLEMGVIRPLEDKVVQRTGYWVPIFPREKADGGECRLITNFRELNKHMSVPHHRAENWKNVLRVLKQGDLRWGIVLDMKSWFHNLSIHKKLGRWMRFSHLGRHYQLVGMPFGWSASPWWSAKLAKPIRAWLHMRSWPHLWWVDDVLLLGRTQEETELRAVALIHLLTGLGIKCNEKKSMKKASQEVTYVGHVFHLKEGLIWPVEEKRRLTLKMVKKQLKGHTVVAQWLAALAGNLLDSCKSNVAIEGLAQQLMREAAKVIKEVKWRLGPFAPVSRIWRTSVPKSSLCVSILQAIQVGLESPCPRVFRGRPEGARFVVTSDASLQGWGALLTLNGRDLDWAGGLWQTKELQSHITHLEAAGSARAIMSFLPHLGRGDVVHLLTDASSTMFAWLKGSKLVAMNSPILEAKMALHKKGVFATFGHIPGKENCTADWISRNHHLRFFGGCAVISVFSLKWTCLRLF
jgi:hypothetical protein